MTTPLKFAVVGCGSIGKRHAMLLAQQPGAVVTALCDSHVDYAKAAAVHHPSACVCADFETLLESAPIDVVDICTPHAWHASMAIAATRAGKHVLVEKPMALTVRDAQQMIDSAQNHGVKLMVVKQNRYNVPVQLAKDALDQGWLGPIHMVLCNVLWNRHASYYTESGWRGRKALEGGALFTQVSHFVDLLVWWFGGVVRAEGIVDTRKHAIEVEDCGVASLQFESGAVGSISWTTCVHDHNYEGSITIIGERGTIKVGGEYLNKIDYWNVEDHPLPSDVSFDDQANRYGRYQGSSSNHARVFADVIEHLRIGSAGVVDGDEAIKTVEAIVSIYAAAGRQLPARTGQPALVS
jgi:predicted dehydrogenase